MKTTLYGIVILGIIVLCGVTFQILHAAEDTDDTITIGTGISVSQSPKGFIVPLLSCDKDRQYGMPFAISPNGQKLAYASQDGKRQQWGVIELDDHKKFFTHDEVVPENQFGVLDFVWSPDSTELFVKCGYIDIGYGLWFKWDVKSKSFDEKDKSLLQMRKLPVSERPDSMFAGPRLDESQLPPVWDRAGVRYDNENVAVKKGMSSSDLQATNFQAYGCLASRDIFQWKGKHYLALSDVGGKDKRVYIFEKDKVVSAMPLVAPPANGLWFISSSDGHATVMYHIGIDASSRPSATGIQQQEWLAIDIGRVDAVLATYVVRHCIVLDYLDGNERKVMLYDPAKLATSAKND